MAKKKAKKVSRKKKRKILGEIKATVKFLKRNKSYDDVKRQSFKKNKHVTFRSFLGKQVPLMNVEKGYLEEEITQNSYNESLRFNLEAPAQKCIEVYNSLMTR